jgi:hypothetical protein
MQLGILPEGRKQKEEKLTLVQTNRFLPKNSFSEPSKRDVIVLPTPVYCTIASPFLTGTFSSYREAIQNCVLALNTL